MNAGDPGIMLRGPHVVVGRNGQELQMSIDDVQYETIHTFPATEGEFFQLDLPTDTFIRIVGSGPWTYAAYNQMSG
jgi:hypothetical protein